MVAESNALFKLARVYHMLRNIFHIHVFLKYRVSADVRARIRFKTDQQKSKFSCPGADLVAPEGQPPRQRPRFNDRGGGSWLQLAALSYMP